MLTASCGNAAFESTGKCGNPVQETVTSDIDVSVQIGADAPGVAAGAQEAGEAVAGLGAELAELIRAQTGAITEGFAEMAEVGREAMTELKEGEEEAEAGMLGLLWRFEKGQKGLPKCGRPS